MCDAYEPAYTIHNCQMPKLSFKNHNKLCACGKNRHIYSTLALLNICVPLHGRICKTNSYPSSDPEIASAGWRFVLLDSNSFLVIARLELNGGTCEHWSDTSVVLTAPVKYEPASIFHFATILAVFMQVSFAYLFCKLFENPITVSLARDSYTLKASRHWTPLSPNLATRTRAQSSCVSS